MPLTKLINPKKKAVRKPKANPGVDKISGTKHSNGMAVGFH